MSIVDADAVFVIGAGVSAPFGLSLGVDLISEIRNSIAVENNFINGDGIFTTNRRNGILNYAVRHHADFVRTPIHGAMASQHIDSSNGSWIDSELLLKKIEKLRNLEKLLDDQTSETIDDFIVENPSYAQLVKICIASKFMISCYDFDDIMIAKPFSTRFFSANGTVNSRNWIHLLINIIRQGINSGTVTSENKINIITFNYDKILENVFEMQFSNTEKNYSHYSDYVEIIHVHGECGDLNDLGGSAADICRRWAEGIHVVNEENIPTKIAKSREDASNAIRNAGKIYFAGFSFSGPNCRLLKLESPSPSVDRRVLSFCNYDGNIGISKIVRRYERTEKSLSMTLAHNAITEIEEVSGTADKPLGVGDWIKLGSLGELPG